MAGTCTYPDCSETANPGVIDGRCDFHSADPNKDNGRVEDEFLRLAGGGGGGQIFDGWIFAGDLKANLDRAQLRSCRFNGSLTSTVWSYASLESCYFAGDVRVDNLYSVVVLSSEFTGPATLHMERVGPPGVEIKDSAFKKIATFNHSNMNASLRMSNVIFAKGSEFKSATFDSIVEFESVDFGPRTTFAGTDISNVIFRKCKMAGVAVAEARGVAAADFDADDWRINESGPYRVFEDIHARETHKGRDFVSAERAFREIRRSLEDRRHFVEAGHFASRELDMRRLAKGAIDSSWGKWSPLRAWLLSFEALYFHLSRYGDSIARPTLLLIGVLAAAPFLLALGGTDLGHGLYEYRPASFGTAAASYGALLAYGLRMAALLNDPPQVMLLPGAQFVAVSLRIVAPFFALLISLAVRRRFRR